MARVHAVMIPFPLYSHIIPMLQFAKSLIAKQDIQVTLVNNRHNHDRIQARMQAQDADADVVDRNIDPESLHLVWVENGLASDFDYGNLKSNWAEYHAGFANMRAPLLSLLQSMRNPPVSCVIFGSFCPWAPSLAAEIRVPSFLFWTQSATVFCLYYHAPLLASRGFFPYKNPLPGDEQGGSLISYIPGVAPIHPSFLPTLLHVDDLNEATLKLVRDQLDALRECDGVIINSCSEIEMEASSALKSEPFSVYLVGPLLPSLDVHDYTRNTGISIGTNNDECLKWLDNQKENSVLYISFGSIFDLLASDLLAIALALKANKQPYLWARRAVLDMSLGLPKNFIEETNEYGLMISWAPQLQVLSHPSVGAFLTHCGWNSILEALSMGVPIICFPIASDQPTNGGLVVNTWNAGLSIKRELNDNVDSDEVSTVVRRIFSGPEGKKMGANLCRLKEVLRTSVQAEGISHTQFNDFVHELKRGHMEKL